MTTTVSTNGRRLARTWRDPLARAGLATRGALYVVLGILAIQFARGELASEEVNQTGAFEKVAEQPMGKVLLVLMVIGLLALTAWRLLQAFVGDPIEGDEAKDRAKFVGKAVIYGVLTGVAIKVTVDAWTAGPDQTAAENAGDQQQQQTTST